ncbi:hypothetical protein FRC06_009874 [Ceratobasidium sp. 370]|nr:hypothetical protein FRC06_009874 [Ceratobasidium sp. 370]
MASVSANLDLSRFRPGNPPKQHSPGAKSMLVIRIRTSTTVRMYAKAFALLPSPEDDSEQMVNATADVLQKALVLARQEGRNPG